MSRDVSAVGGDAPFYLVAELEWDSMEALREALESEQGQATAADVANLVPDGRVHGLIFEVEDVL